MGQHAESCTAIFESRTHRDLICTARPARHEHLAPRGGIRAEAGGDRRAFIGQVTGPDYTQAVDLEKLSLTGAVEQARTAVAQSLDHPAREFIIQWSYRPESDPSVRVPDRYGFVDSPQPSVYGFTV